MPFVGRRERCRRPSGVLFSSPASPPCLARRQQGRCGDLEARRCARRSRARRMAGRCSTSGGWFVETLHVAAVRFLNSTLGVREVSLRARIWIAIAIRNDVMFGQIRHRACAEVRIQNRRETSRRFGQRSLRGDLFRSAPFDISPIQVLDRASLSLLRELDRLLCGGLRSTSDALRSARLLFFRCRRRFLRSLSGALFLIPQVQRSRPCGLGCESRLCFTDFLPASSSRRATSSLRCPSVFTILAALHN